MRSQTLGKGRISHFMMPGSGLNCCLKGLKGVLAMSLLTSNTYKSLPKG